MTDDTLNDRPLNDHSVTLDLATAEIQEATLMQFDASALVKLENIRRLNLVKFTDGEREASLQLISGVLVWTGDMNTDDGVYLFMTKLAAVITEGARGWLGDAVLALREDLRP